MKQSDPHIGDRYGHLIICSELSPHLCPSGTKERKFLCKCDCGKEKEVLLAHLKSGHTISCGCYNKEKLKKFNTYEFFEDYVVGYTSKGEAFKVDLEDYEKIKEYYWYVNGGYLIATIKGKPIRLHRFIMNPPNNMLVDHINHDKSDNRKSNLRVCT